MYLTPKILLFLSVQFEKYKIELAVEEIKSSEPVLWKPGRYYDKYHRVGSFERFSCKGRHFTIRWNNGVHRNLILVETTFEEVKGVKDWIVNEQGNLTHQLLIKIGRITGYPNQ